MPVSKNIPKKLTKLLVLFERFGPVGAIKLNSKSKGLKNVNGYCEFLKEH